MRLALPLAALILAAPAIAQDKPREQPGRPDPKLATSGTYKVNTAHTQLLFTVNHLGISEYTGQFVQPTGSLVLDTRKPGNSRVSITFPVGKVRSTVPALDEHLKTADFFDVAKFPTATFVSTRIAVRGVNATITGNLTLKGITRAVTLNAHFVGADPGSSDSRKTSVGFAATGHINRSDFGILYALPNVSDRVDLTINAAFETE